MGILAKLGISPRAVINQAYDYVIVGGGSAGCVLANRLSTDASVSVLLIEAGKKDSSPLIRLPFGWMLIAYHKKFSWMHKTKASPAIDERRMDWPRGKVLGGSSATNGMIYIRGQAQDYEDWLALGNEGWGWRDCLPYFKKSEDYYCGANDAHGAGGLLHVSKSHGDELGDTFLQGCEEAGLSRSEDFNGGDQEGAGYYDVTIKNGVRQSTAETFLKAAHNRPNLTIVTETMANRVLFEGDAAVGVNISRDGITLDVSARREVLLCGGAINTPQLLQLSGVGPRALLRQHSIPVVKELAGVGENLQDHLGVMVAREITKPITLAAQMKPHRMIYNLYLYLRYKRGIINTPSAYVGAFFRSRTELQRPDMQLHFTPASGYREDNGKSVLDEKAGATTVVTPCRPESRGSVRICSTDPEQHPEIDANYMATDKDRKDMLQAIRKQRELFASPAMAAITGVEIRPGDEFQSDDDLLAYIRQFCVTNYHPVGTCKMGNDPMAVVDTHLRVHGLRRLRVIDASIMPTLISGNTNATTIMIAERGADFIQQSQAK
ncbi:MAG: choline dehydrogenase [Gammaproteobacteria bacterium]|nr:choline dehydrogenase [Gammaproteobacteria bacterium]